MPRRTIVIGANGAGETTWCERHREELPIDFYNADSVANGLGDWNSARNQREARESLDQAIEHQPATRSDFEFESTYSGHPCLSIVRRAEAFGYEVAAVFVGSRGPEINVDRVKACVADQNGHDVPKTEVPRRWTAARNNGRCNGRIRAPDPRMARRCSCTRRRDACCTDIVRSCGGWPRTSVRYGSRMEHEVDTGFWEGGIAIRHHTADGEPAEFSIYFRDGQQCEWIS